MCIPDGYRYVSVDHAGNILLCEHSRARENAAIQVLSTLILAFSEAENAFHRARAP